MLICSSKRNRNSYVGDMSSIPESGKEHGKNQVEQSLYCQQAVWSLEIDQSRMYDTVHMLRT